MSHELDAPHTLRLGPLTKSAIAISTTIVGRFTQQEVLLRTGEEGGHEELGVL
jgi:hypothetical protein